MKGSTAVAIIFAVVVVVGMTLATLRMVNPRESYQIPNEDIVNIQCPNGTIWVHVQGVFVLGSGRIDSAPEMAYVIQYLDQGRLRSLVFPAEGIKEKGEFYPMLNRPDYRLTVFNSAQVSIWITPYYSAPLLGGEGELCGALVSLRLPIHSGGYA